MRITLIQPSRGRPEQARKALFNWKLLASASSFPHRHILSLDADDDKIEQYRQAFSDCDGLMIIGDNRTMVDALNACLPHLPESGPVVTLFDDMVPSDNWNVAISNGYQPGKLLKADCGTPLQTICAGCSSVFKRWGYIYYPGYISMYADNDYQEHAELEKLFANCELRMSHNHPAHGTAETDATYQRQNHMAAYKLGERILTRRRACGFAY